MPHVFLNRVVVGETPFIAAAQDPPHGVSFWHFLDTEINVPVPNSGVAGAKLACERGPKHKTVVAVNDRHTLVHVLQIARWAEMPRAALPNTNGHITASTHTLTSHTLACITDA